MSHDPDLPVPRISVLVEEVACECGETHDLRGLLSPGTALTAQLPCGRWIRVRGFARSAGGWFFEPLSDADQIRAVTLIDDAIKAAGHGGS